MIQHAQPEYRQHKTVSQGQFAPGATIAQAGVIRMAIPINTAGRFRFRFECDVAGALTGKFLTPGLSAGAWDKFDNELDGTDRVATTGNPDPVVVTANTEAVLEITDLCGEAYLLVEFTEENVAAGTVTFANFCQL